MARIRFGGHSNIKSVTFILKGVGRYSYNSDRLDSQPHIVVADQKDHGLTVQLIDGLDSIFSGVEWALTQPEQIWIESIDSFYVIHVQDASGMSASNIRDYAINKKWIINYHVEYESVE